MAEIGSVWADGSWAADTWAEGSWADTQAVLSLYANDLTAAVMDRVADLRVASALADLDSTSLLSADITAARSAEADRDDLNTTLWLYLTQ